MAGGARVVYVGAEGTRWVAVPKGQTLTTAECYPAAWVRACRGVKGLVRGPVNSSDQGYS